MTDRKKDQDRQKSAPVTPSFNGKRAAAPDDAIPLHVHIIPDVAPPEDEQKSSVVSRRDLEMFGLVPAAPRGIEREDTPSPEALEAGEDDEPDFRMHAKRNFAHRPRVRLAATKASNISLDSYVVAMILEEELRRNLPDNTVDHLVTAALLFDTQKAAFDQGEIAEETIDLINSLNEIIETADPDDFDQMSTDVQRILMAQTCSELEMIDKTILLDGVLDADTLDIAIIGDFICRASEFFSKNVSVADERLLGRCAKVFNDICRKADLGMFLNEIAHVYTLETTQAPRTRPKPRGPGF